MYALVDCNNFYVSCERMFDPSLNGKPVIVLSNNDGCAISRSDEAKALGIEMGAVPHLLSPEIKKAGVRMFSSNYTLYGDMSDRVMKTLADFVTRMEVYSIDEAFLDMHQMPHTDLYELGVRIKTTIQNNIGIPVCVGIAPTKALAKMANRFAKKYNKQIGVHWAGNEEWVNEMLAATEVGDVWGIGRQYALMLKKNNIHTAKDFVQAPEHFVRASMSVVGLRLQNELKGLPCIDWEKQEPKKNICCGRSFGNLTSDKKIVQEAVSNFAANCALKLRQQNSVAREIKVFINTNPHRLQDKQYYRSVNIKMDLAECSTPMLIKYALKGLDIIYRDGYNYMKCGVELNGLVSADELQLSLFSSVPMKNHQKALKVLDKVNNDFGRDTVRFGIQGFQKNYKARAALLSPKYTTRLTEIIHIKN